jgi:phage gpG-like protein
MIKVDVAHGDLSALIARLPGQYAGHPVLMRALAADLLSAVEDNFAAEGRPKWAGLHPKTVAGRAHDINSPSYLGGGRLLQRSGRLANSISASSDGHSAQVGTNVVYAAAHQFGVTTKAHVITAKYKKALAFAGIGVLLSTGASSKEGKTLRRSVNHPGSKIPARPFLSLTAADDAQLIHTASTYLASLF